MRKCAAAFLIAGLLLTTSGTATASVNPLTLVNTLIGTSGTQIGGPIDTFPGADVPFGMVQWSPDTPSQNAGGGYEYTDHEITGFSLTHISGPGCSVFGDIGILPTTGSVTNPASARQPFSHADETTAPGWYSVSLGAQAIQTRLTVTQRSGLGQFTFPASSQANVLFNASSDQAGVRAASVRVVGRNAIEGSASSGAFCGMPDSFNVYFVAEFDRAFSSYGTWKGTSVAAGSPSSDGPGSGAWVTFDTSRDPVVKVKVGLSFVSVAGARANLRAENRGWDLVAVRNDAAQKWQQLLGSVEVDGGSPDQQRTFYTALYHSLLHPNIFSDVDGRYPGFDGRVHQAARGHVEYANFSDWDIYRTQVPLMALLAPREASDMMQSLVDAAHQSGWLPRWPLVNGATSVMGGDSVDPVIAGAYAFGARDFDLRAALAAMEKGASDTTSPPADGWYVNRPELSEYLSRGYIVNTHTTSVSPVPNGASETLEYALDDFSIAQFAHAIDDRQSFETYLKRSSNWGTLFDTATGWIAPRDSDGAFMQTPITDAGQSGFQEGNAAQYTWMVPQDLAGLIRGMGGNAATVQKLDTFFTQLDADQNKPYAWLGNEPSLGSPWVYLSAGAPWRTQQIVRDAITTLYGNTPDGIPGNDDLGAMSSWYVWCAMGLYPQNPSIRSLDIGSPLFPRVVLRAAGGPTIEIDAPQAATNAPYVQRLRVNGKLTQRTWVALPLHGNLRLAFDVGSSPNRAWGSALADAPPSYGAGPVVFPPSTAATIATSATSAVALSGGKTAAWHFTASNGGSTPVQVAWHARVPNGLHLDTASGTVNLSAGATQTISGQITADANLAAGYYNVRIDATTPDGVTLANAYAIVRVGNPVADIAYVESRFDNTVTPVDLSTGALGPKIAVGNEPRDAVLSPDHTRLYVTDRGSQSVSVIDTARQAVIATVKVGNSPNGVAISTDGKTVWIANNDDGTVQSIDTATLTASKPIAVGANPRAIAIAPDGTTAFVSNTGSNTVTPINTKTGTARSPIDVGRNPSGIAVTPDGKMLYVADTGSNEVTPVDLASGRALAAIRVGVSPQMIAISPDSKVAYVTNYATTTVTPIDLATKADADAFAVGGAPYGVAFTKDGKTAVVVNRRDNDCVTIDVATGHIGAPILINGGPYTIALP